MKTDKHSTESPRRELHLAALGLIKWVPALMAFALVANNNMAITKTFPGEFGHALHCAAHVIGLVLLPVVMLYVVSFTFRFCNYHRMFIHYILVEELINTADWYYDIPVSDETMATIHAKITSVFLFLAIILFFRKRWAERKS
jgi:hypothetical protein